MVPRPLLALRQKISPLSAAARRTQRLSRFRRGAVDVAAVRCAAADPRTGILVCARAGAICAQGRAGADRRSTAIAPRTARRASADCLRELGLPQPATTIVTSENELRAAVHFPVVIKTSIGTASRGVWFVRDARELDEAVRELVAADAISDEVLVQDFVAGTTEKAQAVFCRGELLGFHAYRGIAVGVGGGEAVKESGDRPQSARCWKDRTKPRLARRDVDRLFDARAKSNAVADRL